jgi:hypothetical protein
MKLMAKGMTVINDRVRVLPIIRFPFATFVPNVI